jgi:peroxiredoxin
MNEALTVNLRKALRRSNRTGHTNSHRSRMLACNAAMLWALAALMPTTAAAQSTAELAAGTQEMIGRLAPELVHDGWANSQPVAMEQLIGKVVLLRFFGDQPAGAAAVRELIRTYQPQGLTAVGVYVPSPMPTATEKEYVRRMAISLGFNFPVAVDSGWETVNRYWLNRADAEPSAATFLIDRRGVIRYIQPDGRYEKGSRDRTARREYENLEKHIQSLLKEPSPE